MNKNSGWTGYQTWAQEFLSSKHPALTQNQCKTVLVVLLFDSDKQVNDPIRVIVYHFNKQIPPFRYTEEQGMVGTTEEQGMVGTQRSRVWWVHRGAGYGGYTEEQGMVGTQRSRVWWAHRGAGYGRYTEEQGMVGTQRSKVW